MKPFLLGMARFQGGIVKIQGGYVVAWNSFPWNPMVNWVFTKHLKYHDTKWQQVTCWSLLASKGLTRKSRLRSGFMMRLVLRSGSQFGATYPGLKSAHRGFGCLNPYRFFSDFSTTLILLIFFYHRIHYSSPKIRKSIPGVRNYFEHDFWVFDWWVLQGKKRSNGWTHRETSCFWGCKRVRAFPVNSNKGISFGSGFELLEWKRTVSSFSNTMTTLPETKSSYLENGWLEILICSLRARPKFQGLLYRSVWILEVAVRPWFRIGRSSWLSSVWAGHKRC